jgi:hypothetical protein
LEYPVLLITYDFSWGQAFPHKPERYLAFKGYCPALDDLSVTKGVVSRVCMKMYAHSLETLLAIQIDAAINPGNSGGPAIQGMIGKMLMS